MSEKIMVMERSKPTDPSALDTMASFLSPTHRNQATALSLHITKAASKQAYYTIRLLADRDRQHDAYRAYAYFRWVDDWLDQPTLAQPQRVAFLQRQQRLVTCSYRDARLNALLPEERLVVELIQSDPDEHSGLHSYITNMMAVMAFDTNRRWRQSSALELDQYTLYLATAVTDALHYFIGHEDAPCHAHARYFPAIGAHIAHMLRDTVEDVGLGYFNIPREFLQGHDVAPGDVESAPYRDWVKSRVNLARRYFEDGVRYLDQVQNLRCRLAGYAYIARFVGLLDTLTQEDYRLRRAYPEFKRIGRGLRMGKYVVVNALKRGR
jgi:phytoene/squalene synthetase